MRANALARDTVRTLETNVHTRSDTYDGLAEESAEDLYENAPCGYISTLPDGTIVRVNRTFLSWTGYQREELLGGKRFQDLLAGSGRIFHETHYAPLLRMQGSVTEINFDLVHKGGGSLPVLVNTIQKRDAAGTPLLHRTTLFNIADRKRYEQDLLQARKKAEQAARAKADFLSMMSHEIRTPMNAIIGLSNVLRDTTLSPEQQKYVGILQSSSENLLALLNNILDFSKIEAGKVSLEERRFNVRQLLHGIFYGLAVKAEEKQLAVRMELDPRVPECLMGDPVKLGQVLTNLVGNAIKFTERGAVTLAVTVRELSSEVAALDFTVSDSGIGIPQDRMARIFEEFSQASYDINMKYGGSGLGLSICQKLLGLYGSKLEVRSVLGEGSSFSFHLRLKVGQSQEESASLGERGPKARSIRGLKVLVAEDNSVNVFVLSQFLRKWGVDFEVVENGQRAVEKLQQADYDLVLMDLQMPVLDGYAATRAIRELPGEKFRRLPIVALTASTRLGQEKEMGASGFTDLVGKPFSPEELFAKLALHGVRPTGSESRAAPAPGCAAVVAPERGGGVQAPPRFSLERFRSMAEGDGAALAELCTLAIHNSEEFKRDVQRALETGNREAFEFQAHKMKMTLELMQAHEVRAAMQHGRTLLAEGACDAARLQAAVRALHREMDALIEALKEEVRATSLPAVDRAPTAPAVALFQ